MTITQFYKLTQNYEWVHQVMVHRNPPRREHFLGFRATDKSSRDNIFPQIHVAQNERNKWRAY